jgi:hypothetical protein
MYHDVGEPGPVQPHSCSQASNTCPNYDNLKVRDPSLQIVLSSQSVSAIGAGVKEVTHSRRRFSWHVGGR